MPEKDGCCGEGCLAIYAIQLVGSQLKLTVLHGLLGGPRRFNDLRDSTGISQSSLARTLRELEAAGLCERNVGNGHPPGVEYMLTDKGEDLQAAIEGIEAWTRRWLEPHEVVATVPSRRRVTIRGKTPW